MKYSLLFLMVMSASCGDYKYDSNSDRVGEIRPLEQVQMTAFDVQNIQRICEALSVKEQTLNGVVNTNLAFSTSQVDCEGNNVPAENVSVSIQNNAGVYVFKQVANGLDFLFPVIETTQTGTLSPICGSLQELTNPIVAGNQVTYFTTSGIQTEDCESKGLNEICVKVEKATVQADGASSIVHTKEWIRVRTYSSDLKFIGYVTNRKKVSKGYCGRNEVLTHKATLKIN